MSVSFVFPVNGSCPEGDINGDCIVDNADLLLFASQWLGDPGAVADLVGNDGVNLADYSILAGNWLVKSYPLVINEFMASNSATYIDDQGQYDDWIEIYNAGQTDVDMAGMYLTDDLDNPAKWSIPYGSPGNTTVVANGYLLIWADGDTQDGVLHANFKLSSDGEEIALFDIDGKTIIDSIEFSEQVIDISFGREPDASDNWVTLSPTPGETNNDSYIGLVADTKFSIDRGFYDSPFDVSITCETEGVVIYYTTNGSCPVNPDGIPTAVAELYATANRPHVSTTTCLCAFAAKPGWKHSNTDTQTYIFLDDVIASGVMDTNITQDPAYASQMRDAMTDLPTVSLAADQGILEPYLRGPGPYPDWTYNEFPVSIEWITQDGSDGFQENAGISRFGGHWYDKPGSYRPFNKWSFRIYFRSEYGATKLRFPLFEGYDHGICPVEVFDHIELHSGSHDMSQRGFYMSGRLTGDTMLEMGNINPHGRFVHLYINGVYWGQYNLRERWNADMNAQYLGGEKEDYEAINTHINQGGWDDMGKPYDGDGSAWQQLLSVRDDYEALKSHLDVSNYIDFMLIWMFGNSEPEYRCVGPTSQGSGFKFWINDADGFTRIAGDKTGTYGPGWIFAKLNQQSHPDYKMLLADRIHKRLFNNGALTGASMTDRLLKRCDEIKRSFFGEAARWGYLTPTQWANKRDSYINDVLSLRTSSFLGQLRSRGLYPAADAPVFNINGSYRHGGEVSAGDILTMTTPAGIVYYTSDGSDPRDPGGAVNLSAQSYATGETQTTLISTGAMWKYLDDGSYQGTVWRNGSFNDNSWVSGPAELGYGDGDEATIVSSGPDPNSKYITTYFRRTFSVSDTSMITAVTVRIKRDDGAVVYLNGTEIHRGNMPAGSINYLTTANEAGEYSFNGFSGIDMDLLITGDNIIAVEVHQASGTSSDISFDFELTATNSSSRSDEIVLNKNTHIMSRAMDSGTWSALNEAVFAVGPVADDLRITEIMYRPAGDPNSEFIELKNIGSETINLNLVQFTNGVDFTFPAIDLAAGEHVVVVRNIASFNDTYDDFSGTIAGEYVGALDNDGDRVRLEDAIGTTIHDFKFKDGWYDITDGGGFTLTVIDPANAMLYGEKDTWRASTNYGGSPGSNDIGPNPGDIVINELLAHSDAQPNDWIELYNSSESEINIGGWYLSDNNDDDPNLMKYRISDGTTIEAGSYAVFAQDDNFGLLSSDGGKNEAFALSENGDKVCLTSAIGGQLTGYREVESFGASEVGVTLGRHYKASTDTYNFVAMSTPTKGLANAYPKVGPIVISEIMYHPAAGGTFDKDEYEFVELYNVSGSAVTLYDSDLDLGWTFTDGIDYTFASGTTIAPNSRLVIARNIAAFTECYGYLAGVLGPFANDTKLSNGGERLQLAKPGDIDAENIRQYIRIDRVTYSDGSHPDDGTDPWPTEPDGNGKSLTRKVLTDYGNDVANWQAQQPTPGI